MEVYNTETSTSSILHLSASHLLKQVRCIVSNEQFFGYARVHVLGESDL